MTVNSNYEINSYKANGVITSFAFDFQVLTKNDLVVNVEDLDGNITEQIIDVDYSVSLNENDTGNIIFNTAPANDYNVYIQRNILIDQNVVYKTSSGFQAEVVETSLDKLTMINQQQQSDLDKCLKLTQLTTDNVTIGNISIPEDNKTLIWKKVDEINNVYNIVNSENNPDEIYDKTANDPNVVAVGKNIDNINTTASNITNINDIANDITNINNVASNIGTINSINNWISTSGGSINYYIGQIISVLCSSTYVPNGCLPCDGAEYTKAQFPDLWNNYLTATTPLLETCTYEEYQQDITTYGQCIKFAVDTDNNKFKVPTIKDGSYIIQAKSDSELGRAIAESLPNIRAKSYSTSVGTTGNVDNNAVISGAYEIDSSITVKNIASGGDSTSHSLAFNASLSSSTYQDGAKVQGDNVGARFFVVVANGEINQSQMDWSAWATSLQGKANTDLSNTASNIDYVIESGTNDNGWYRKYKSGWIEQGGTYTAASNNIRTITFPTPFTTEVKSIQITSGSLSNAGNGYITEVSSNTLTSFNAIIGSWSTSNPSDVRRFWEAKGF